MHQNRFPGHSLYYIDDIIFVSAALAAGIVVIVLVLLAELNLPIEHNHDARQ
jgi:hypothetical protein